jgi:hypothetical protein
MGRSGRGARRAGTRALLTAVPRASLQLIGQLSQLPEFCRDLINCRAHVHLLPHILVFHPSFRPISHHDSHQYEWMLVRRCRITYSSSGRASQPSR